MYENLNALLNVCNKNEFFLDYIRKCVLNGVRFQWIVKYIQVKKVLRIGPVLIHYIFNKLYCSLVGKYYYILY